MTPSATSTPEERARIGPNAVLQLTEALWAREWGALVAPMYARAGSSDWLSTPPAAMVDERRVARLHREVRATLPPDEARAVMADAGRRTADYLLANRIPRFAQAALKVLPASLAARLLVGAIRANAWTFAGSSRFTAEAGAPTVFILAGNPLCAGERAAAPQCAWHAAVFQRLFQSLVAPGALAVETHCQAAGHRCCRFVLDWRAKG